MSEEKIPLLDVRRIDVRDGDVLAIIPEYDLSKHQARVVVAELRDALPENVRAFLLPPRWTITVVGAAEVPENAREIA